jgi:RNA polymerase sigma factor (sigma-70 family)
MVADSTKLNERLTDPYLLYNLRSLRESKGYTQTQLGKRVGVSCMSINQYERLRQAPPPQIREKIAKALGTTAQELFPERLEEIVKAIKTERTGGAIADYYESLLKGLEKHPEDREYFASRLRRLDSFINPEQLSTNPKHLVEEEMPEMYAERNEVQEKIRELLQTLSPRERECIKLRYGLSEDGKSYSLGDVAKCFQVTRERVCQIEMIAMRRLEHPSRTKRLKGFFENP